MKKVFKVRLHMKDGSISDRIIIARDDVISRNKAEKIIEQEFKNSKEKYPGIDYAEIELVCTVDAG